MIAYKGFNRDLTCTSGGNRFQYKLNEWNVEPQANCAENGFHCAENPLDCLTYYPDWNRAVYYMVEAAGDIDEDGHDSKISCTRLRLIRQLNKKDFVYQALLYITEHWERADNGIVQRDTARNPGRRGFVIVRGKNPKAAAPEGTVIGLLQEATDSRRIIHAAIAVSTGGYTYYFNAAGKIEKRCAG